jgi:hypothetical protein
MCSLERHARCKRPGALQQIPSCNADLSWHR